MEISFDPLTNKTPYGPICQGKSVSFELTNFSNDQNIYLLIRQDGTNDYTKIKLEKNDDKYIANYSFETFGHYWYCFELENGLFLNKTYDNYSYLTNKIENEFFQLVTKEEYDIAGQMQGGIIYQIFVDRFCKYGEVNKRDTLIFRDDWGGYINKNTTNPIIINKECFGGNLLGVVSKLDYLKELGVTTIYLNPICYANSNHKYDTADYMQIDPAFGTESDFKQLIESAKVKGIKIIIDGVYNHTGSDSIYFNKDNHFDTLGAFKSKESRYFDWYEFEDWPKEYKSWWGINTLPSIKHNCSDFQDYIAGNGGVVEKFMKLGVAGVRLDVVDEITDEFTEKIANKVKEFGKDKIVVGEVWEDAATKISYSKRRQYFLNNELSSVMNYPIKESILEFIKTKNPYSLVSTLRMLKNNYPKQVLNNLMNFLGTHDTNRIFTELKNFANQDENLAKFYLKIATILIFTLPGVPSIFYGDEYGIENNDGSCRACYDWNNRKTEIFDWYLKLTKIRKFEVFKDGETNILFANDGKFVFERTSENEHIVTLINLGKTDLDINLQGKYFSFFDGREVCNNFLLKENEFNILIEKHN